MPQADRLRPDRIPVKLDLGRDEQPGMHDEECHKEREDRDAERDHGWRIAWACSRTGCTGDWAARSRARRPLLPRPDRARAAAVRSAQSSCLTRAAMESTAPGSPIEPSAVTAAARATGA